MATIVPIRPKVGSMERIKESLRDVRPMLAPP
jgi:hypothetical protein